MPLEITDEDGFIKAGLSSNIMRLSMESKGLLEEKGSIYIGTGETIQINYGSETVNIAKTTVLPPGNNGEVLAVVSENLNDYKVRWSKVTHEMIEETQRVFSTKVSYSENTNFATDSKSSTYVLYDSTQENKSSPITLDERLFKLGL